MKKLVMMLVITLLAGCSTRVADLTVVSTKNFNMNSGNIATGGRVVGSSNVPVILFPIGYPSLKEAVDNAIEKDRCAVGLSNAVIYNNFFAFLFGYVGISVKGDLIIDNNQAGCGGYTPVQQQSYVKPPVTNSNSNRDQQLIELERQNLPYNEYQRRYQQIMGQ